MSPKDPKSSAAADTAPSGAAAVASPEPRVEAPSDREIAASEKRGAGTHEMGFRLGHDQDPLRRSDLLSPEEIEEEMRRQSGSFLRSFERYTSSEHFAYGWIYKPKDPLHQSQIQDGWQPIKRANVQTDKGETFPTEGEYDMFDDHGHISSGDLILARMPMKRAILREKMPTLRHIANVMNKSLADLTREDIESFVREQVQCGALDPFQRPSPLAPGVAQNMDISHIMREIGVG